MDSSHDRPGRGRAGRTTFQDIIEGQLSRRTLLAGAAAAALPLVLPLAGCSGARRGLDFASVPEGREDLVRVPDGYEVDVVVRWGDPMKPGLGAFDLNAQSAAEQARRFGFNNDMIALFSERYAPPGTGGGGADAYILCVNQEYTTATDMFPGLSGPASAEQAKVQIEASGISVIRVARRDGRWSYDPASPLNRRLTGSTPFLISGPAAGHARMRTGADPEGTRVHGTLGNCSGGFTPWGTYLSGEENIQSYFGNLGAVADAHARADLADFGVREKPSEQGWEVADPRFDLGTPEGANEPFRFGYVVEVDPYSPDSVPKKRTALGRCKHEGAQVALARDGRAVVYTGDDERFEYAYKFVSRGRFDPADRAANMDLLDSGTLYVARFNADFTGQWLPLDLEDPVSGPLLRAATYADGAPRFASQADICINTRRAADALGATPMDRPEDFEPLRDGSFTGTGRVFLVMTNNNKRGVAEPARGRAGAPDAANPRAGNVAGHIVEITEAANDCAATQFAWRQFLVAGDPAVTDAKDPKNVMGTMAGDRFACPDNIAFDSQGNMWVCTDGNPKVFRANDGIVVVPTDRPAGQPVPVKRFLVAPPGAEVTGPLLAPDDSVLFCAIQHPGEDGETCLWPDGGHPRPAVIAVRRKDGGPVGT